MTLQEIARIYTDLVLTDERIPENESTSKEEVGILRSKYHQILMDKLTEEGIEFYDRFDAMKKAFEIIKAPNQAVQPTPTARFAAGGRG